MKPALRGKWIFWDSLMMLSPHPFVKGTGRCPSIKSEGHLRRCCLFFLLVPVLNLSGLNSSRMEKRSSELGIRKAFGATRTVLIQQLVTENFLLTFFGRSGWFDAVLPARLLFEPVACSKQHPL